MHFFQKSAVVHDKACDRHVWSEQKFAFTKILK